MSAGEGNENDDVGLRLTRARPEPIGGLADEACLSRVVSIVGASPAVRVGRFLIEKTIGKGASGEVFRAHDPRFDQVVALKLLNAAGSSLESPARALREAKALGKLNHPNIVKVIDVLVDDTHGTFIAMEYVDGEPLFTWQAKPRPWQEVLAAYLQAGEGLAAAHAAGLLHLDLKPANILVGRDGRVRVADFGLARDFTPPARGDDALAERTVEELRPLQGTIPYASPEQRDRLTVDERSDVYSYCVALYEGLHGALPFTPAVMAARRFLSFEARPRAARGKVPHRINAALLRGVAADPSQRWRGIAALLQELRRVPWYRRTTMWAFGGAVAAGLPGAILVAAETPAACPDPQAQLNEIWNETREKRLRATLADAPIAFSDTTDSTVTTISAFAEQWLVDANAACTPGDHVPVMSAAMPCLERGLVRLDRTLTMLEAADPAVLGHVDKLLQELTSSSSCVAAPTSPEPTPPRAEITTAIDEGWLWLAAGDVAGARRLADTALFAAERDTSAVETHAEALLLRGHVQVSAGAFTDGITDLESAAARAIEAGREDVAARAWNRLARTLTVDLDEPERARSYLQLADAAAVRAGRPAIVKADILDTWGLYHTAREDGRAAEQAHRQALAELERVLPEDAPRLTQSWMNIATARSAVGDLAGAREMGQRVLEARLRQLGPRHPSTATAQLGLAMTDLGLGDARAAANNAELAAETFELVHGPDSIRVTRPLMIHAQACLVLERWPEAERSAARAWAIQKAVLPRDHDERVFGGLGLLINIADVRGDRQRELALLLEARAEAVSRDDNDSLAMIDINIGWTLIDGANHRGAETLFATALPNTAKDSVLEAHVRGGLGVSQLALGKRRSAVQNLQTSSDILAGSTSDEHAELRKRVSAALHEIPLDSFGNPKSSR